MNRRTGSMADELARMESRSTRVGECLRIPHAGYGVLRYERGRQIGPHRAAYLVHNGPIAAGLVVRHTCDHPGCIEPSHLILGTTADNNRDMVERGRQVFGERQGSARVSAEVVAQAVAEYLRGGQSQAAIAAKYGVSQTAVGRWVRAVNRLDGGQTPFVQGKGNHAHVRGGAKPCGTRAGYFRHRSKGEPCCEPCLEANRLYMRAYKAARRDALAGAA